MKPFEANWSQDWTLAREEAAGLRVRTPSGPVRVEATDGEEIRCHAEKHVHALYEATAHAFLEQITIAQHREGDVWTLEADWPRPQPPEVRHVSVTFHVQVPHDMQVEARSGHGAVEARGVSAARLRTGSGSVTASEVAGRTDAHSGHGELRIESCAGPIEAETGSGDIAIRQARSSVKATSGHGALRIESCAGPVEAETRSGDVLCREIPAPVAARSGHGRIEAQSVGEARLRTGSGELRARDVAGAIEAHTGHGAVHVERCAGPAQVEAGSGNLLVTDAGGAVAATTGHGRIEVTRAADARLRAGSGEIHARDITGSVKARTGHGTLQVERCGGPLELDTRSGQIRILDAPETVTATTGHGAIQAELGAGAGPPHIEMTSASGGIDLRLPSDTSARLEAETRHGHVRIEPSAGATASRSGTRLETLLGTGEGSIRLRTQVGAIHIRLSHPAGAAADDRGDAGGTGRRGGGG